jgi:hypothetical protein
MGLQPTYMDETHLESMSFDGVGGDSPTIAKALVIPTEVEGSAVAFPTP